MKLLNFLALSCYYAQEHIDCNDAWDTSKEYRAELLQCVSYQVACFLSNNTVLGKNGVDWDIIINELSKHPAKKPKKWLKIINKKAADLGGWI